MRKFLLLGAVGLLAACKTLHTTPAAPAAVTTPDAPAVAASTASVLGTVQSPEAALEARLLADVKAHEAQFGKNHPHVSNAYLKLAEFHRKHGNPEKEKMWLAKAWSAAEAGIAAVNPVAGLAIEAISAYHRRNGDPQAAAKVYDDAVDVMEQKEGSTHPLLVDSALALGETYRNQGRHGEAVEAYNRAFKAARDQFGGSHPKAIAALTGMTASLEAKGETEEAKKTLGMAIDLSGDALESKLPDLASLHEQMGDKLATQGDYQGALIHYQKELSILRVVRTERDPGLFQPRAKLADTFADLSRNADAESQYKLLLTDMEGAFGVNDLNLSWLLQKLQGFYAGLGRTSDVNALKTRIAGLVATPPPAPAYATPPSDSGSSPATTP